MLAATSAILDSGNDKELCAMRKETIERVFAGAAKKHRKPKFSMLFGAAGRIRTAGLILTKRFLMIFITISTCF